MNSTGKLVTAQYTVTLYADDNTVVVMDLTAAEYDAISRLAVLADIQNPGYGGTLKVTPADDPDHNHDWACVSPEQGRDGLYGCRHCPTVVRGRDISITRPAGGR